MKMVNRVNRMVSEKTKKIFSAFCFWIFLIEIWVIPLYYPKFANVYGATHCFPRFLAGLYIGLMISISSKMLLHVLFAPKEAKEDFFTRFNYFIILASGLIALIVSWVGTNMGIPFGLGTIISTIITNNAFIYIGKIDKKSGNND